jgi:hypothetical protein
MATVGLAALVEDTLDFGPQLGIDLIPRLHQAS